MKVLKTNYMKEERMRYSRWFYVSKDQKSICSADYFRLTASKLSKKESNFRAFRRHRKNFNAYKNTELNHDIQEAKLSLRIAKLNCQIDPENKYYLRVLEKEKAILDSHLEKIKSDPLQEKQKFFP